jgi:RHS repeat-associated protein
MRASLCCPIHTSYDAAGNQTNDGYSGNGARTYDAENRALTAAGTNGSNSFAYNADGRRVRRVNGSTTTLQVFGIGGELLAEYTVSAPVTTPTKEYGYRGGQLLITAEGSNLKWLVTDHLGTARLVLDKSGRLTDDVSTPTIFEGVIRHDYLPFGEEVSAGVGHRSAANGYVADGVRQKFGSKERDAETGLDYFEARYYSSVQGRFTSPDEFTGGPDELFDFAEAASDNPTFYADLDDPQSLNKYQYCYNNPLGFTDLDGHKPSWLNWDNAQRALDVASFVPELGTVASLANAGISNVYSVKE